MLSDSIIELVMFCEVYNGPYASSDRAHITKLVCKPHVRKCFLTHTHRVEGGKMA